MFTLQTKEGFLTNILEAHPQIGATFLGAFADDTPEWHELRNEPGIITGSQIGTICGLNPWESPLSRFYKATKQIDDFVQPNMSMKLGKALEQPLLDVFASEHPDWTVYRTGTWQSAEFDFMRANPDAFFVDEFGELCLIEVKFSRAFWGKELPAHYRAQVIWYLGCLGLKRAIVVALADSAWTEIEILFDQFEFDWMVSKAQEFRAMLASNTPPAFDGSSSTYEAQRLVNPDIDGSEIELAEGLGVDLVNLACQIDELTTNLTELKSRALDQMGKAKVGYIDVEGEKIVVAKRQSRNGGSPFLTVTKTEKGK
jgi:putative phage-type endonuclease